MLISKKSEKFSTVLHEVDFCIVGGGMAGISAAIAAARRGIKVALIHDRPVLGGNASSEIRMWICGAHGDNLQETGLVEEIALANIYRNPKLNFSIWDSVLYEIVRFEPNIKLFLNCSCCDLQMEGVNISYIKAWQTTTQTWHEVKAKYFADCSGDSVLAPLSGAEWRWGRESSDEFLEDIEPKNADRKTMGLSCLIQAREITGTSKYIPPKWANKYTNDDLPFRIKSKGPRDWATDNFWWIEIGGEQDSIKDTEELRDELLKIAFGVWDHIKNSGNYDADHWELDWVGFLPGKRESRRYVGDYILTQNDVRSGGKFNDLVAYGGWTMDDHHPGGINYKGKPNIFHPAPSPYGIPYRCLYSNNISNLFVAGRNISATHAALSSTRVMATCAMIGQAVGTAAVLAVNKDISPRGVYEKCIHELKQNLMDDDCYLPWNERVISSLTAEGNITTSSGDPVILMNGKDRPIGDEYNAWIAPLGSWVAIEFKNRSQIKQVRIVFDSDLNRQKMFDENGIFTRFPMRCNVFLDREDISMPKTLIKAFRLEIPDSDGNWKTVFRMDDNSQRLVRVKLDDVSATKIRLIPEETWGSEEARIFAFEAV